MNTVAVYRLGDGSITNVCFREGSSLYEDKKQLCKEYEELGAKLVSCIITNNKEVFYKARLKAMLMELRDVAEKNRITLEEISKQDYPQEVIEQTKRLIEEEERTLVMKVAVRCSSLLYRDIPVTDELALACYNYRQSWLDSVCE